MRRRSLLRSVWKTSRRLPGSSRRDRFRLTAEALEARRVLASDVVFSGGTLTMTANSGGSGFAVTLDSLGVLLRVNGAVVQDLDTSQFASYVNCSSLNFVGGAGNDSFSIDLIVPIAATVAGGGGNDSFGAVGDVGWSVTDSSVSGGSYAYTISGIETVFITAGDSANTLDASTFSGKVTIDGRGGNDTITGGNGDDTLIGGEGDDTIDGRGGNDGISGGNGTNTLRGGQGNDSLSGGSDVDTIFGDEGNDTISGGGGNDILYGDKEDPTAQDGNDSISAGAGNDQVYGGGGNDSLNGGDGDDTLRGGTGADYLSGDADNDTLEGEAGNDSLYGGSDNDILRGGDNDDLLQGQDGDDTYDGGAGTFDAVSAQLVGSTSLTLSASQLLLGGETDTLATGLEQVFITGTAGDDVFDIRDAPYYVTVSPGSGTNDRLIVTSDAPRIRPTGSVATSGVNAGLILFDIRSYDDGFNQVGAVRWSGRGLKEVELRGGPGDNTIELDQWKAEFKALDGGGGNDTLAVSRDADMTLTDTLLTISTGGNIPFANFERADLSGGAGKNKLDASAFSGSVSLYGGDGDDTLIGTQHDDDLADDKGNDTLIGNGGNDVLSGGDGNDSLDGGVGDDQVFEVLSNGATKFVLSDTKLTGRGTDKLVGIEGAELRGLGGNDTFDVGAWSGRGTNLIFGNGGNDALFAKADADFTLKYVDADSFSFERTAGGGTARWTVRSVESAAVIGGGKANTFTFEEHAGLLAGGLSFDGGGGTDVLNYRFLGAPPNDVKDIELSNTQLVHSHTTRALKLKAIEDARLRVEAFLDVSGWTKRGTLETESPDDVLSIKSTNNKNFTVSGSTLTRSDGAFFTYRDAAALRLTGGGSANKLVINADAPIKDLSFDGLGGKDVVTYNLFPDVQSTTIQHPGNLIVQSSLQGGKSVSAALTEVEQLDVVGTSAGDIVTFKDLASSTSNVKPAFSFKGSGGNDTVEYELGFGFTLSLADTLLQLFETGIASAARTIKLDSIENAVVSVRSSVGNTIDVSGWTRTARIETIGSSDVTIVSAVDADATLADSLLMRSNGANIAIVGAGFESVALSGGSNNNRLDATASTRRVVLRGGVGKDTLLGGTGDDDLFGEDGDDTLDAGGGTDTIDGGKGIDRHKNGETVVNCEAPLA